MKPIVNEIIVVEGTNDASLITSLIDAEVVTLNGCELQNIRYLKAASKFTNILLLTDPDAEGHRIREKFNSFISNVTNIEIDINKCTKGTKNGVAECENNEVLRAISPYFADKRRNEVTLEKIFSKQERKTICNKLDIEEVNNKQFLKRMIRLNMDIESINKLLEE